MSGYQGRTEGETGLTRLEAWAILHRMTGLAARTALADGLTRMEVADSLRDLAYAIETQDVAEDMSPLPFPMS